MSNTNKRANTNEIIRPKNKDLLTPNLGMKYNNDAIYIGQTRRVPSKEVFMVISVEDAPET